MTQDRNKIILTIVALLALLLSGSLYADKVYKTPEPPPNVIYTIKGPVVLYKDASAGDLITAPNLGTIYYLNHDKERVVFPDEQTFLSWYPNFEKVKTIPQDVLESYPLSGRNATIRPGTKLITIPSSNQVWFIAHPNNLFWLDGGEEQAIKIFGENWAKRVVDVPEYYYSNYNDAGSVFPALENLPGVLVHVLANDKYFIVDRGIQIEVTQKGLTENFWKKENALQIKESLNLPIIDPPIDSYESKWSSPDIKEQVKIEPPLEDFFRQKEREKTQTIDIWASHSETALINS